MDVVLQKLPLESELSEARLSPDPSHVKQASLIKLRISGAAQDIRINYSDIRLV